jgi:hypothetical protein
MTNAAVSFTGAGDAPSTQPGHDPVFGDPSLLAAARANQVKGNLVSARSWYVREHYGDEMHARLAAALPAPARAMLETPPLPMAWCPMGEMMDIDRAILEVAMDGDFAKMKHFGGAIAKHDLPTLYKVLFKVGTPAFVMRRIGVAGSAYLRGMTLGGATPDGHHAIVTLSDQPMPYYFCAFGVSGWFQAAVELSGGRNVHVKHASCRHARKGEECVWNVAWE